MDEAKLAEVDARSKSNTKRIDSIEKKVDDLTSLTQSVAVLATKLDSTQGDVKEIKDDVKVLMDKPAKRFDSIIEKILIMVVAAFVTYFLTKLGL